MILTLVKRSWTPLKNAIISRDRKYTITSPKCLPLPISQRGKPWREVICLA